MNRVRFRGGLSLAFSGERMVEAERFFSAKNRLHPKSNNSSKFQLMRIKLKVYIVYEISLYEE